ncbi:hypothetical protein EPH_0019790 [Eimeria praecox]|uniref:Uncharacterized protein n=1 Tax=Eimeria praecox TaxID=51316 RepID=U6G6T1_9EIME|nr:hypothetical protein EPH_0019790 [Eimeria praecox]
MYVIPGMWTHPDQNAFHSALIGLQEEAKRREASSARKALKGGLRRLSEAAPTQAVKFPVQCLQLHDTVAWWVGDQVYPVFLKDSLLNTNAAIDISTFLQLASAVGSTNEARSFNVKKAVTSNLEYFVYTFSVEGVFAFGTNEDNSPQAIFSVVGEGVQCPSGTRYPEAATDSSLAHLRVQLQQSVNVEPDLTIFLLTFACLLVALVLLLMSISEARRRQYKKRQALNQKDINERKDLVLGIRKAALTMKRRLESLLADLIEQRLCKQDDSKVLALQPEQLESMLNTIPKGTPQPQAFENAFGALHELSINFKSFSSTSSHQFHRTTKDIAVEISDLQKAILTTLEPIRQRLQHRDRLREQMGPIMENISRLLGELRSTDLFMNATSSSNDSEDLEEGEHALIVKRLLIPASIGDPATLHLRLLQATVCGERFTTQNADRFQVFAATTRLFIASAAAIKNQLQGERCTDALSQEKDQLLQEAHSLLTDGCKLLASGAEAKEGMRERFVEYRRRENDILDACRKQHSAAMDAEVSLAVQSLIDHEDSLLQLHLGRVLSLASAAQGSPGENRNNSQKASRSLQAYSNECRAQLKQALKSATEALQKRLGKGIKPSSISLGIPFALTLGNEEHQRSPHLQKTETCMQPHNKPYSVVMRTGEALAHDEASSEAQQQQREALVGVLLDQKARGEEEYLAGVHRLERQLLLLCTQLAIQNKKAVEEEAFQPSEASGTGYDLQAAVHDWTSALQSAMRTEAQNLRRQAKAGSIEESEYRKQKASLASSLDLNIQRITREQFANKLERIDQFEREATRAYESLMDATRKRQRLEEDLRSAEADLFGSLVRRRLKHAWRSAAEERKLLRNSIITSWSRASANQERLFEFEVDLQNSLAAAQIESVDGEDHKLRLQRDLKDRKQLIESSVETMMDKCRELQGQLVKENFARMDELLQEQEDEMKAAIDEAKASLSEPRELWLRALICEADLDAETQGNLQAMGEQHALSVAVSCLEAAGQRYYNDAAAEEKEKAEFESLALVDEQSQAEQLEQRVLERTSLLKTVFDEEFHRSADALWAAFQQHLEACKREEDLLTWQSGQINERLEASSIHDNRLKQPRGPDWAASCASSGPKVLDGLQGCDNNQDSAGAQTSLETPQTTLISEFWARSKGFLESISRAQKEIILAESEWLQKCQGIQGGRTRAAADEAKMTRAQNTRLEHMKEAFRSKAAELRKDYAEEIQSLLEEDKEAEAQMERSRQAEEANLEMSFRVSEASQDSPEEREKLKTQREQALAEMLKDLQAQRDIQKANIQRRLEKAKAALVEKQEQLRQQFEACKEEARKEFLDLSNSLMEKERNDKKAQLLAAARMNPSAENIYALHNQLMEEYREDIKALVLKQMQEKAKYRQNAAMEQKAEEARETGTLAGSNEVASESGGAGDRAEQKRYSTRKTSELHQAKVREIQEAAQDAALQDEALGLQEDHLARVIETLREFAGPKDSPANALLEQARQEKSRLTQERDDLRRFVSARLQEVEKLVLERRQAEEKRKQQESHAAIQQLKMAAKAQEAAARKQAQEKQLQRQQQRHVEEARKLQQFIEAMGSEGKTLDDLRQASDRRMEKLRRATERERQRQKEVLASKRNSRAARQAKMSRERQAAQAQGEPAEMHDAQGLLQTIATKCAATVGESANTDAGENDFRKFVWKMDVKSFAEERLQKLGEALIRFLERVESATNSGEQEAPGVAVSGELRETVLQVTKLLQAINVAHSASRS